MEFGPANLLEKPGYTERISDKVEAYCYSDGTLYHVLLTKGEHEGDAYGDVPADIRAQWVPINAFDGLYEPQLGVAEDKILMCYWLAK